jgi:hypothetical protein
MAYLSTRYRRHRAVFSLAAEAEVRAPQFSLTDDLSVLGGFILGFVSYLSNGRATSSSSGHLSGKSEEIKAAWRNGFVLAV